MGMVLLIGLLYPGALCITQEHVPVPLANSFTPQPQLPQLW